MTHRVGVDGYTIPWLHVNNQNIPTTYDITLLELMGQIASMSSASVSPSSSIVSTTSTSLSLSASPPAGGASSLTPSSTSSSDAQGSSFPPTPAPSSSATVCDMIVLDCPVTDSVSCSPLPPLRLHRLHRRAPVDRLCDDDDIIHRLFKTFSIRSISGLCLYLIIGHSSFINTCGLAHTIPILFTFQILSCTLKVISFASPELEYPAAVACKWGFKILTYHSSVYIELVNIEGLTLGAELHMRDGPRDDLRQPRISAASRQSANANTRRAYCDTVELLVSPTTDTTT